MAAGRPPNVMRPVQLTTNIPEDLRAKLDLHLFSQLEGRVPHGAYSRFLAERIREFFEPKPSSPVLSPTIECPDCGYPLSAHRCPVDGDE